MLIDNKSTMEQPHSGLPIFGLCVHLVCSAALPVLPSLSTDVVSIATCAAIYWIDSNTVDQLTG